MFICCMSQMPQRYGMSGPKKYKAEEELRLIPNSMALSQSLFILTYDFVEPILRTSKSPCQTGQSNNSLELLQLQEKQYKGVGRKVKWDIDRLGGPRVKRRVIDAFDVRLNKSYHKEGKVSFPIKAL
ncbi:hypothetical protein BDQ17DRAFT_1336928 [Cyathus striatus]|nr:hypothetical protein BDQ17DRAFT_1336928 [Cyathus striatus]